MSGDRSPSTGAFRTLSSRMTVWSEIRPLLGRSPRAVATLIAASIVAGFAESGILAILAEAAAAIVNRATRVHVDLGPIHFTEPLGGLFAIVFALGFLRLGLQWVLSSLPARITADLNAELSSELFGAFTRSPWEIQSRDREGYLQELATNQMMQASFGAVQATTLVIAVVTFFVLVLSALTLNPFAALVVLVAATVLSLMLRPLTNLGGRQAASRARASIRYAEGVNEAVRLTAEAKVLGVEAAQRERIDNLITGVRVPFYRSQLLARLVPGTYQSLMYLLVAAALTVLYLTGAGHVAALGAVVLLLLRAGIYGQQAQSAYQMVRQYLPNLQNVEHARQHYLASIPVGGTRPLEKVRTLVFDEVSFSYERGMRVLSGITFEVSAGESIGIVGPTGAGKSTVVQILLGLRRPEVGRYLVNDLLAADFKPSDWHRSVAYLAQAPNLLHATVADNIRFFRQIDDEAMVRAARLAGIHDDIASWPHGYETVIGPRADAISGGQQQRICLARALATRPEVLVLDEPTSALDPHTERRIRDSLAALKGTMTLFVVAHRMSTLGVCDRVMVLVDGQLQAFDEQPALKETSSYYRSASALAAIGAPSDHPTTRAT